MLDSITAVKRSWIILFSIKLGSLPHLNAWQGKAIRISHVGVQGSRGRDQGTCSPEIRLKEEASLVLSWVLFQNPEHRLLGSSCIPKVRRSQAPAQPAMWKFWVCPAKENTPACPSTPVLMLRRASVFPLWVLLTRCGSGLWQGRAKKPGGSLICN